MHVKKTLSLTVLFLLALTLPLLSAACAPAVPLDQMPGSDLYSSANSNRMTADAALRLADRQEQDLTATAQAPVIRITETAAALAVEATHAQSTSVAAVQTQAGAMTATAIWWTPTPQPTATPNATGTLEALALSAAQTQTTLNLQRAQDNNDFKGKLPAYSFVIVVLVLAIVLMGMMRRARYQTAQVDARGNLLPILDVVDGTFTDVDRSPNHRGPISNGVLLRFLTWWVEKKLGIPPLLPEVTAARQDAVTYRDQLLDLASRGLPAPSKSEDTRKAKVGEMMTQPQITERPHVEVIAPDMALVRPILLDVVPQIAQDSIEAELYEQKKDEGAL